MEKELQIEHFKEGSRKLNPGMVFDVEESGYQQLQL